MFLPLQMYDFPLEVEAVELPVQLQRMKTMFNLEVISDDVTGEQRHPQRMY